MANQSESPEVLCSQQPAEFVAPSDQQELRNLYEEQQRRLSCSGCGEDPFID